MCRDDMPCEVKKYPIVGIFGGVEKVEKFIEPVRSQPDPDRFHSQSTITLKFGSRTRTDENQKTHHLFYQVARSSLKQTSSRTPLLPLLF